MTPMTRNQAIRRHRILWRWLTKNPDEEKHHWPGWESKGGKYRDARAHCFLCEFSEGSCFACPLVWPESENCNPIFNIWHDSQTKKKRSTIAKQIAELPPHPTRGKE